MNIYTSLLGLFPPAHHFCFHLFGKLEQPLHSGTDISKRELKPKGTDY